MVLNATSRNYILTKAILHAYGKRERDLANEHDRIAKAMYDALVPKKVQDALAILPVGWYQTDGGVRVNVGPHRRDWDFTGNGEHGGPYTKTLRLPGMWNATLGTLTQDRHAALIERINTYDAADARLKSDKQKTKATLDALLKSVRTLEMLGKVWPEGVKFYHDVSAAVPTPPGLPVVAMCDLNAALGLENRQES